jgi:predicted phosphodiesterase
MRLLVYSDLHLEIAPFEPAPVDADVVVLAGDIDNGTAGMEWARRSFPGRIVYVPGNHEYYDGEFHAMQQSMRNAASRTGIEFLDCDERVLDGVRFLGCTLWTDFSLAEPHERAEVIERSRRYNPDHIAIQYGARAFSPEDAMALCGRHRAWLEERLAERFDGPTVVITHFAPHQGSIAPAFDGHPANPGFIIPLQALMGPAALWIHGHTHTAFDYAVRGTRIVCNPRGYPDESPGFRSDCLIEIT